MQNKLLHPCGREDGGGVGLGVTLVPPQVRSVRSLLLNLLGLLVNVHVV